MAVKDRNHAGRVRQWIGTFVLALACLRPGLCTASQGADLPPLSFEAAEDTLRAESPAPAEAPGRQAKRRTAPPATAGAPVDPDLLVAPALQTVVTEGFEGTFPAGPWTAYDNNGGAVGGDVHWDDTFYRSYAGSWSGGCAAGGTNAVPPGGTYPNYMDSWMVYGPFSLSDANAATLAFRYWLKSESSFDYFKFMVSTNGTNFYGYQTSGNSGGWVSGSLDLTAIPTLGNVTGQPQVWIAFAFTSDYSVEDEGAYVDEIFLQKNVGTSGPADIRIDPLTVDFTQQSNRPIYVELDWMEDATHSHRPSQAVVDRIVQTFAAAGFQLNLDVSNAIPHQSTIAISNAPSSSSSVQSLMSQYFNHAGDSRYYYSIWGHNYSYNGSFTTSSGIADLPGQVHLVTLGSFSGQTGTFSNQVGTFIHEFGHNLGQRHGGIDHDNYKPNYLSVMNYFYQLNGLGPTLYALGFANTASGFDDFSYSHGLMPSLNESSLDENFGIGLGRAVDWNCSGTYQTGLAKDIQSSNPCSAFGGLSTLTDYDNWTSLASQIRTFNAALTAEPPGEAETCITPEEQKPLHEKIEQLRAVGLIPPEGTSPLPPAAGDAGHSFFIYNDGGGTLTVSSLSLDTATSWIHWAPQAPFTIAPGKSQEVLVFVDFAQAPEGQTTRRLVVQSNDPDESPYPGGVYLVIWKPSTTPCYALTRTHTGSGADPTAVPSASAGCLAGQFHAGEVIALTAAPTSGWYVTGWSGTNSDSSTLAANTLTMPAASRTVSVAYQTDVVLTNGTGYNDSLTAPVSQGTWRYYYVDLLNGSANLVLNLLNLSADADLYVRFNAKPTLATWDCRPLTRGTTAEQCSFPAPAAGRWWVGVNNFATGTMTYTVRGTWTAVSTDFYTLPPCRIVDTRTGSPLSSQVTRNFTMTGACGVPSSAKAVSVNVTVIDPAGPGNLALWPANQSKPGSSVLNFQAASNRANNAILTLATDGGGQISAQALATGGGTVHLLIDVNGYFQ